MGSYSMNEGKIGMKAGVCFLALVVIGSACIGFSQSENAISLMPMPRHIAAGADKLAIRSGFTIRLHSSPGDVLVSSAAESCRHSLEQGTELAIHITQSPASGRGHHKLALDRGPRSGSVADRCR